ncbi:MAG: sugar phosphate isomerase/epimerase [Acidobacteriaceae bacterium]|nr:sugar phosphate isomerase/epimerase [Acidobacteriaceae bacterium]
MPNRRDFLMSLSGLLAQRSLSAAESMRFAVSGFILWGRDADLRRIDEGIENAKRFGYKGIEPYVFDVNRFLDKPKIIKDRLDKAGLSLVTLSGGGVFTEPAKLPQTIEYNLHLIRDFIAPFGCKHLKINVEPDGERPKEGTTPDQLKTIAAGLNELGKRTGDLGLKLGFHPHIWSAIENEHEMNTVLNLTDPKLVYLVPDTAHLVLGGMDPVKVVREHYNRIVAVHIKDTEAKYRNWRGPTPTKEQHAQASLYKPLGTGGVDFPAFFGALRERSYRGWVTLDVDEPRAGEASIQEYLAADTRYLRDTLHVL